MADLLKEIEAQIAGAKATTARQTVGVIREIGDGVAKVEGLADVMLNEMLDFGEGITGLALNLDETEVGAIILGDYTKLQEGNEVHGTGKLLQVPVGKGLLGPRRRHARASRSTARAPSPATSPIRSRSSHPASSGAVRSASPCRPASCPSTR